MAVIAANVVRLGDFEPGAIHRRMLNTTSSTVKGSPFDHRTPARSLKSQVSRSSEGCQLSARYGCVTLSESTYVRNSTELRNRFDASIHVVSAGSVICCTEQTKRRVPPRFGSGPSAALAADIPNTPRAEAIETPNHDKTRSTL